MLGAGGIEILRYSSITVVDPRGGREMSTEASNRAAAALLTLLCFLAACVTDPFTGERKISKTAAGALIGAAGGAAIGALAGRDRAKGALIGAGAGALAGGAVGAYMDVQEAKLRERLRGTGVSVTRTGDNLILNMPGNVTFATDRADIRPTFYEILNSVALVLKEYDKTIIEVMGHTDSTGSETHNQGLSERRAASVGRYLVSQGVDSRRVLTQGFGERYPMASNETAEGRQQNRRVELRLVPLTRS
jgi:outer membrane protein OmpA-like peptidoglycan-associated protein